MKEFTTMSEERFVGVKEDGSVKIYYKLFEYDLEETGKHYLVYTDNEKNENGQLNAYAATVTYDGEEMKLEVVETEEEWAYVEAILEFIKKMLLKAVEEV